MTCRFHTEEVIVRGRENEIARLMSVLLDNAVKYIETLGILSISLFRHETYAVLEVKNTCDQLPKVIPQRLFDRFYRDDQARTQKNGGLWYWVVYRTADCNGPWRSDYGRVSARRTDIGCYLKFVCLYGRACQLL